MPLLDTSPHIKTTDFVRVTHGPQLCLWQNGTNKSMFQRPLNVAAADSTGSSVAFYTCLYSHTVCGCSIKNDFVKRGSLDDGLFQHEKQFQHAKGLESVELSLPVFYRDRIVPAHSCIKSEHRVVFPE